MLVCHYTSWFAIDIEQEITIGDIDIQYLVYFLVSQVGQTCSYSCRIAQHWFFFDFLFMRRRHLYIYEKE